MKVVYLVLFPSVDKIKKKGEKKDGVIKHAPHFLDIDINVEKIAKNTFELYEQKIFENAYIYDQSVFVVQYEYEIGDTLKEESFDLKVKLNEELKSLATSSYGANKNLVEEYTVLLVDKVTRVRDFVEKNQFLLARFVRSLEKKVNKSDADEILTSKVSYSKDDVAIVDWEGAILIDPDGDFDSQIELLKIGNYQLVRYRILDLKIEKSLGDIRKAVSDGKKKIFATNFVKSAIENKLSVLLDFDKVDQSILLVGDWYSANLYRTILEEFYIDDWRNLIKNKLDNLEAIDATAREHLVYDWNRILDILQLIGWMVLLVGYIVLYFKDAGLF